VPQHETGQREIGKSDQQQYDDDGIHCLHHSTQSDTDGRRGRSTVLHADIRWGYCGEITEVCR
jgi:hypothetical protein